LVAALEGDPNSPRPEDSALIDVDANQLHETDGTLTILTFVPTDDPVAFYTDKGQFVESAASAAACGR